MKKILLIIIMFVLIGCNYKDSSNIEKNNDVINSSSEVIDSMKILIDNKEYVINLEDNDTTKYLVNMLPLELDMSELNGNEKYVYLSNNLPTNYSNPKHISVGDVMLYGDNCLVIFYKSFDTSYSYTRIGHIDNLENLGTSDISVKLYK